MVAVAHRRTARPELVESEIRAGFCDSDGEMLEIHNRREWRRVNGPAKGRDRARETAIARMPQEKGRLEARRRDAAEAARHLIGYLHADRRRPGYGQPRRRAARGAARHRAERSVHLGL